MKTLFWECNMGAAGDMMMAALLELHDDPAGFISRINGIGIPGVTVTAAESVKCGIRGTHITVRVNGEEENSADAHGHEHPHAHPHGHEHTHEHPHGHEHAHPHSHNSTQDIARLINGLRVSDTVKRSAIEVYHRIAEAESHVHGVPVNEIHFHEVGNMDAVTDIVGVCMLMDELAPELVLSSPVHVGSGRVRCAHGILPVPAPATAYILKDTPIYGGAVRGELCTPTAAALLRHFAAGFGAMPAMAVSKIGYGMGKKDFDAANCVRAFWGHTGAGGDEISELVCNLDDMTPEAVAFVQTLLLDQGALDVYTIPIGMKKGRTGILLACMCRRELTDKMVSLIFRHTTTLGMRHTVSRRYTLQRKQHEIPTQYGPVRVKTAFGYGVTKSKPEYEDIARIARDNGLPLAEVTGYVHELENARGSDRDGDSSPQ